MDFLGQSNNYKRIDSNLLINKLRKESILNAPKINYISNTENHIKVWVETENTHNLFGTDIQVKGHCYKDTYLNQSLKGFRLIEILDILKKENFAPNVYFFVEAGTIDKQKTLTRRAEKIADTFKFSFVRKIPINNSRSFYIEYSND